MNKFKSKVKLVIHNSQKCIKSSNGVSNTCEASLYQIQMDIIVKELEKLLRLQCYEKVLTISTEELEFHPREKRFLRIKAIAAGFVGDHRLARDMFYKLILEGGHELDVANYIVSLFACLETGFAISVIDLFFARVGLEAQWIIETALDEAVRSGQIDQFKLLPLKIQEIIKVST
jgi:hypothetical protein